MIFLSRSCGRARTEALFVYPKIPSMTKQWFGNKGFTNCVWLYVLISPPSDFYCTIFT